jgi:signal transduction histidine kinase
VGSLVREIALAPSALPPLAGAFLQLALAAFLVLASGERRLRLAFALVALCASLWSGFTSVALATSDPAVARVAVQCSLAAIALAGPAAFEFAASMTRSRNRWLRVSQLFGVGVAAALLSRPSLLVVVPRPDGGFWPRPCLGFALVFAAAFPSVTAGALTLARAARQAPPSRRRRQLSWAAAAIAFGGLGGIDVHTVFDLRYPVGWATSTLSCATLFYAVVQYRLMAIRTVVQRIAVVMMGLGLMAAWLWLMTAAGARLTPARAAAWVLTGFAGMRLWISRAVPALLRLLDARRRRLERSLIEFERSALEARSNDDVLARLGQTTEEALGARLVALFPPHAAPSLTAPLLRDLLDIDAPPTGLAGLEQSNADALVPISHRGERLGVLAFSGGELRAADDEMAELLARLGEAAGRALVSARLYQEVALRSEGLEAEVRRRTAQLEDAFGELTATQAKLAEAERSSALGLLVAGVSHEINNALNFISANLPTLGRYLAAYDAVIGPSMTVSAVGAVAAGGAARVEAARKSAPGTVSQLGEAMRRTSAIVGDLRKFARPDTERRPLHVTDGIDAALNLLRRRTDGRVDVARLYAGVGLCDGYPGPLNQCFFNLLLNAVEAARSEIWVEVRESESGVEVIISDDGDGVPAELSEEIFRPFFTTRPKAAGLGLTVSRAIVERHGGTLLFTSPDGGGARVSVRLPPRAKEREPT